MYLPMYLLMYLPMYLPSTHAYVPAQVPMYLLIYLLMYLPITMKLVKCDHGFKNQNLLLAYNEKKKSDLFIKFLNGWELT